jgi:hypothetical protein
MPEGCTSPCIQQRRRGSSEKGLDAKRWCPSGDVMLNVSAFLELGKPDSRASKRRRDTVAARSSTSQLQRKAKGGGTRLPDRQAAQLNLPSIRLLWSSVHPDGVLRPRPNTSPVSEMLIWIKKRTRPASGRRPLHGKRGKRASHSTVMETRRHGRRQRRWGPARDRSKAKDKTTNRKFCKQKGSQTRPVGLAGRKNTPPETS